MRRKVILMLVLILALSVFAACTMATVPMEEQEPNYKSMFVVVEITSSWKVVYHKDTRVMYAVSNYSHNAGHFTLLVDADGNPLLWEGRGSEECRE